MWELERADRRPEDLRDRAMEVRLYFILSDKCSSSPYESSPPHWATHTHTPFQAQTNQISDC